MEVRRVVETDDFIAIARIYASSWKAAYRGIVPQDYLDAIDETRWAWVREGKLKNAFVLTEGGLYIGISTFWDARDEKMAGWGELVSIYLLPEYFGLGLGGMLLDASLDGLLALGYENVYLWVLRDNVRARAFYKKKGFTPSGEEKTIAIGGAALEEIMYVKHFQ